MLYETYEGPLHSYLQCGYNSQVPVAGGDGPARRGHKTEVGAISSRTGKEQLIAIHGNRFVLHLIFQKLLNEPVVNGVPVSDARIGQLTGEMLQATILNVLNHYPTAYPANLFKNASKCRDLSKRILEEPVPAAAV